MARKQTVKQAIKHIAEIAPGATIEFCCTWGDSYFKELPAGHEKYQVVEIKNWESLYLIKYW